jgi:hypothetical protein
VINKKGGRTRKKRFGMPFRGGADISSRKGRLRKEGGQQRRHRKKEGQAARFRGEYLGQVRSDLSRKEQKGAFVQHEGERGEGVKDLNLQGRFLPSFEDPNRKGRRGEARGGEGREEISWAKPSVLERYSKTDHLIVNYDP